MTIVLSKSNSKIGNIISFSLPSKITCPGLTEWCDKKCYAARLERIYPNVSESYQKNMHAANSKTFVSDMIKEIGKINKKSDLVFRLHVSGDFYSIKYINSWIKIISANPSIKFYAYTKSWRIKHLIPSLKKLNALPNMTLFASTDISIGAGSAPCFLREAFSGDNKPTGIKSAVCPAQVKIDVKCSSCNLCSNKKSKCNIFFRTH